MADEPQVRFAAFMPSNPRRQNGDGSQTDDDQDKSHAHISSFEDFSAMIRGYWMGSLEHVQNETTCGSLLPACEAVRSVDGRPQKAFRLRNQHISQLGGTTVEC